MALLFFLSGVFSWPSVERDGDLRFLARRAVRLGAPLLFGVTVLMPLALYPVYRESAVDPGLAAYARAYLDLPFDPIGPLWFLWLLLAFTLAGVALRRFARRIIFRIGDVFRRFDVRPVRTFVACAMICTAAYLPLALLFSPWTWSTYGPFALQLSRPLLYAAYYCAGLGVGTAGLGRGVLRADGPAVRNWKLWMAAAAGSLFVWMGLTDLAIHLGSSAPLFLSVASDASYALAGACSAAFALAACLRFGADGRWPLFARLSDEAFGVYVLHYAPIVWLQYALLGLDWPAPIKAAIVLCGVIGSCIAATAATRSLRRSIGSRHSLRLISGS